MRRTTLLPKNCYLNKSKKLFFIKNKYFFFIILLKKIKGDNKLNVNNKNFAYELPSFAEKMMIEIEEAKDKPSLLKKFKEAVNRFLLLFVSNAKKNKAKTTISNKITSLNGLNRYLKDNNENTLDLFSELKKGITLDQIGDYGLKLKQLIMLKTYPDLTKIEPHEAFGFQKRLFDHFMIDFHKKKEELGLSRARQNKLGGLETMFICCSINKKYLDHFVYYIENISEEEINRLAAQAKKDQPDSSESDESSEFTELTSAELTEFFKNLDKEKINQLGVQAKKDQPDSSESTESEGSIGFPEQFRNEDSESSTDS